MDFLKPKEAKAKLDPRDGWLFKLKSKFTEDEMLFLEEEFDDLECIGMIQKVFIQFQQVQWFKSIRSSIKNQIYYSYVGPLYPGSTEQSGEHSKKAHSSEQSEIRLRTPKSSNIEQIKQFILSEFKKIPNT